VTQIGHEPPVRFDGGCLLISDLNLAAALLSLTEGGAAWDGARLLRYSDGGDEYERFLRLPETRLCHVELTGHHKGVDMVKVERADGWTDPATGRHYEQGTEAGMSRIIYHLAGEYRFLTDGLVTRRVPWTDLDFRFWMIEFARRGGLLSGVRFMLGQRNRLLTLNRENYRVVSALRQGA
jgi:hypothetical protein